MKYVKKVKDNNNKYILYLLYGGWDSNPQLYLTFTVGSKPTDFSICPPPHTILVPREGLEPSRPTGKGF